jgi:hypothetical protein
MKYENIKRYKPEEIRRLTGVKPATFFELGVTAQEIKISSAVEEREARKQSYRARTSIK